MELFNHLRAVGSCSILFGLLNYLTAFAAEAMRIKGLHVASIVMSRRTVDCYESITLISEAHKS